MSNSNAAKAKSWREILKFHPAANLFPLMAPDELKALATPRLLRRARAPSDPNRRTGLRPKAGAMTPPAKELFELRCWGRAWLWREAEFDLHTAVDELQQAAVDTGLVDAIGQDAVQKIMRAASSDAAIAAVLELYADFAERPVPG